MQHHKFIFLGSTKSRRAVTSFIRCQQRQDSGSICNYHHYPSSFCRGGVAGMLIWQPYLLASQLASSIADGQAAAPGQSVTGWVRSQQTPSGGIGQDQGFLCAGRQRDWPPPPQRMPWHFKGVTQSFKSRWTRRTDKEWHSCTCRRSRMKVKPHSIQSGQTPCPRNYLAQQPWG